MCHKLSGMRTQPGVVRPHAGDDSARSWRRRGYRAGDGTEGPKHAASGIEMPGWFSTASVLERFTLLAKLASQEA